jgi:hypothetical protein
MMSGEILRRHERVSRVVERRPYGESGVGEDKVAVVIERGGGDTEVGSGGFPDCMARAIE